MKIFLENIEFKDGQTFLDVGCGDGKILQAMCQKYPNSRIIGYEKSDFPFELALERKKKFNLNYEVYKQDFFKSDIKDVDVIYIYMIQYLMPKIWKKIKSASADRSECKSGILIYSSSFTFPGVQVLKTIPVGRDQKIYVYRI